MNKIYPVGVLLTIGIMLTTSQPSWSQFTGFRGDNGQVRMGPNGGEVRSGSNRVNTNGDFNVRNGDFRAGGNIGDILNGGGDFNFGFGGQNLDASAGDTGAQFRLTDPTGKQADRAQEFFPDPKMAPTWTGEMAHGSVNRAAIPDGGYTFGFTEGAVFPVQQMGGVEYIRARDGSGMQGNRQGYGEDFNFGFGQDGFQFGGSIPIFGNTGGGRNSGGGLPGLFPGMGKLPLPF
jgi:hypothetical protein